MPDPISVFIATSKLSRRYGDAAKLALRDVNVTGIHWDDVASFRRTDTVFNQLYKYSRGASSVDTPDGAICILTPDDKTIAEDNSEPYSTARHNVIFEAGLFIGAFGRERVLLLVQEDVDIPSDLKGVVYDSIPQLPKGLKWQDYLKSHFPVTKIQDWVCGLPPSISVNDDLRRLQRRVSNACLARGISIVLKSHCAGLGNSTLPTAERVEDVLKKNNFIRPILDEQRTMIQTHITVKRHLEVDLFYASDNQHKDVLDTMRRWLATLVRTTVQEQDNPPTKVAILGLPSINTELSQSRNSAGLDDSNQFMSRGVRLLEYAVDNLGYPIIYVDDSRYESGENPNVDPQVLGTISEGDKIIIVHDVALTGRKLVRCKAVLESRGAEVNDACLIVACHSLDIDGNPFSVEAYLKDENISTNTLLKLDVSVNE